MDNQIRAKIYKREQKQLFKKLQNKIGNRKKVMTFLKIEEGAWKNYISAKTRYVPKEVLKKVCSYLNKSIPKILESNTLKEIRQNTIKNTYPALRKKYGAGWPKVLAELGHRTLKARYGGHWESAIAKKGFKILRKRYGKKFHKVIWKRAILKLEDKYGKEWAKLNAKKMIKVFKRKYGKNWAKIVMENARKAHLKRYGKNWAKILSRRAMKRLKEKYGNNYRQELYKRANLIGKRHLTYSEKRLCRYLKRRGIPHETHCIKNGREYDIAIPDVEKPRIVIECSTMKPTTHNERIKILQLLEQKKNFPNTINIAILKKNCQGHNFNPARYKFLCDKGVLVFWLKDSKKVINMIANYITNKNKKLLTYRDHDFNEKMSEINSMKAALGSKSRINSDELKLNTLLKKIKVTSEAQHILKTKYKDAVSFDNFEELGKINIAYEITSSSNQTALRALTGKIAYIKSLYKNLKFIVILNKITNLTKNTTDNLLKKYADAVILKPHFNEEGLIRARNSVLSNKKLQS